MTIMGNIVSLTTEATQKSMNKSAFNLRKTTQLAATIIAAAMSTMALPSAHAGFFDLGAAGGYAALIVPGGSDNMVINGGAAVVGDVAVSNHFHLDLGSEAKVGPNAGTGIIVGGTIYLNPGATVKLQNQPPDSVMQRDLSQAVADAIAANHAASILPPTQNFGDLDISGNNFTIAGNGGCNVIALDSFKLHGGGTLSLSGSANDVFIFNIMGNYSISGEGTMQLLGGVQASNILWNFVGAGTTPNLTGHGTFYGTYLAPNRAFGITDSTLFGAIIAQGDLKITSKALVVFPPSVIPEVSFSGLWIGFAGLICAFHLRRRWVRASSVVSKRP
jgi:choice-of-anchor A domain-containing protein